MKLLVAGAHGRTGRYIVSLLGDRAKALVRSEDQVESMTDLGAEAVVGDLTNGSLDRLLSGCDGVIFAAGAGMDGDPEEVDNAGAVRLLKAFKRSGGERFIMVSSMGTTYPDKMPPMLKPYLVAKRKAEQVLETSGLIYTIVRPGGLTDAPGSGWVDIAPALNRGGSVPREDVARAVVAAVDMSTTYNTVFDMLSGDTPILEALQNLTNA
ncbi:SDR family oxidoreductase [soil metagenome]